MLSDKLRSFHRTLAFRLTVWYAGIFTLFAILAFVLFYFQIASIIRERTDDELLDGLKEFSALLASKGLEEVKQTMILETREDGETKIFYRLFTRGGKELSATDLSSWGRLDVNRDALQRISKDAKPVLETIDVHGRRHRARVVYGPIGPDAILQIGISLEDNDELLVGFRQIFGATMAGVMVVATLLGWFMARRALTQVEEVTQTARGISATDLGRRVPLKGQADEIDRLATTFNDMLDRIQTLVAEMKEMTENIAHDLRSSITRIRGMAEMALTTGKSIDEYESAAASTVEDCDRLLEMINTMLYISQTEAAAEKLPMEEVNMTGVVRDACELFQPVAEDKGVNLVVEIGADLRVRGVLQSLQRMLANLIDNALNYTSRSGTVTVSVSGDEKLGVIAVKDTGIGISQEELPHIFRRFYRGDRSRSLPGTGLGLTLVQAIVHAHGGQISVTSVPNVATTFTVTLPCASIPS
jgi:heavy metal sensor kinase